MIIESAPLINSFILLSVGSFSKIDIRFLSLSNSIILNILKPKNKASLDIEWPQICFFGVFDGHGGSACADYLRDNLHNFVVQNEQFPQNPIEAIKEGFRDCERNFLSLVEQAQ